MQWSRGLTRFGALLLLVLVHALTYSHPSSGQSMPSETGSGSQAADTRQAADMGAGWGPAAGCLRISIVISGELVFRGAFAPSLKIRNDSDRPVRLPGSKNVFAWLLVSQKAMDGSRRDFFTDRVYIVFNSSDWPSELAAGRTVEIRPTDFGASPVYPFREGLKIKSGFPETQPSAAYEKGIEHIGKFADVLSIGLTSCRMMLCLPGLEGAEPAESNRLGVLVAPADLKALYSAERGIFLADLMRQFDGDYEAAIAASRTAIRFGSQAIPELVAVAKAPGHADEAKKWLIRTLAEISDERTVDPLTAYLDDPQADVRLAAAYWGPRQQSDRLDKAITARAATADDRFKAAALLGFLVFRGQAPQGLLKAGLNSDTPAVRASALAAVQDAAGKTDLIKLRQLLDSTDDQAAANAIRLILQASRPVASEWAQNGRFTILLCSFSGENHKAMCESFQQKLVADTGWDKTYVASTKDRSDLCWGRFETVESARKCLDKASAYRTPSGMALFEKAQAVPNAATQPDQPPREK
ncbi:MAG: hypothetical protein HZA50_13310 [Planctomycetes bacterium]|nr:hypothetical protein [Planctomycetota bacterium]